MSFWCDELFYKENFLKYINLEHDSKWDIEELIHAFNIDQASTVCQELCNWKHTDCL